MYFYVYFKIFCTESLMVVLIRTATCSQKCCWCQDQNLAIYLESLTFFKSQRSHVEKPLVRTSA